MTFTDVATTASTLLESTYGTTRIDYEAIALEVIARWRSGEPADAADVLKHCPELVKFRSVAIDLAYEEYCLKTTAGVQIDPNSFCARFPDIRRSLQQQIELHQLIEGAPDLLENFTEKYVLELESIKETVLNNNRLESKYKSIIISDLRDLAIKLLKKIKPSEKFFFCSSVYAEIIEKRDFEIKRDDILSNGHNFFS